MTPTARRNTWEPKGNKFGAVKTELDGHKFDSKREAAVYADLSVRVKAREICRLEVHPQWTIKIDEQTIAKYTADFSFYDIVDGLRFRVIDVKSEPTAKKRDFVLVRKLMKAVHGIEVEVWQ